MVGIELITHGWVLNYCCLQLYSTINSNILGKCSELDPFIVFQMKNAL